MTMETWVLVLWLLSAGSSGDAKPKAVTYSTQATCERGFEQAKSSKTVTVTGRSQCVRVEGRAVWVTR